MDAGKETYSITEVMRTIGWVDGLGKPDEAGREALGRLLAVPGVKAMLGAEGTNRPVFPAASLDAFRAIREAHAEEKVSPKTVGPWLEKWLVGVDPEAHRRLLVARANGPERANELERGRANELERADIPEVGPLAVAEAQGRAQGLAMADKVFTAQEAADFLKVTPDMLRRSVPAWRRFGNSPRADRWLLSGLLSQPGSTPAIRPAARPGFARPLMPGLEVDALMATDITEGLALMNGEPAGLRDALEGLLAGRGTGLAAAVHAVGSPGFETCAMPGWTQFVPAGLAAMWGTMSLDERLLVYLFAGVREDDEAVGHEHDA